MSSFSMPPAPVSSSPPPPSPLAMDPQNSVEHNERLGSALQYYVDLSKSIDFSTLPDPVNRYELLKVIGEGTYGEVYRARDRQTGK